MLCRFCKKLRHPLSPTSSIHSISLLRFWPFLYSFHSLTNSLCGNRRRQQCEKIRISNSNFIVIIMRKIISIDSNLSPKRAQERRWRTTKDTNERKLKIENTNKRQQQNEKYLKFSFYSSLNVFIFSEFKFALLLLFFPYFSALSLNLSDLWIVVWFLVYRWMSWLFVKDIK